MCYAADGCKLASKIKPCWLNAEEHEEGCISLGNMARTAISSSHHGMVLED